MFIIKALPKAFIQLILCLAILGLTTAALAGCSKSAVSGENGEKLTLYEPAAVTLQRGGKAKVNVKIKRNALQGDVAVVFTNLPNGVEAAEPAAKISAEEGFFTLEASDTADLVENSVARVTATGADHIGVSTPLTITVKEKTKTP